MKKTTCLLVLLWGCLAAARAQVEVEVVMDQTEFLSKESVPVAVKIHNHSGQTLRFGTNKWLNYLVEARSGYVVEKEGDPPTDHNFTVETSHVATQHSDLSPYFNLARSGQYIVTATVKMEDWDVEVSSKPVEFNVIAGVKFWEQTFGVPSGSPTNHAPPEVRKYILQRAAYLKHLRLYLRLTDETEANVFRVQPIGPVTSFSEPQTRLDTANNLHLLYEESARTYRYVVFNPDGDILKRQQWYYVDRPAKLNMNGEGVVSVVGARRHVTGDDIPPVENDATNSAAGTSP